MSRLHAVLAIALMLAASAACAEDTYKCTLSNGRVQYQSRPCHDGRQVVLKVTEPPGAPQAIAASRPAAPTADRPHAGNEPTRQAGTDDFPLTLRGRSQPVVLMLRNIAVIYGRNLQIDPSIDAVGDFDYAGVALPSALADMAARFALQIELKPGLIVVKRR